MSHGPGSRKVNYCYTFPSFCSFLPWKASVNSGTSKDEAWGGMSQEWSEGKRTADPETQGTPGREVAPGHPDCLHVCPRTNHSTLATSTTFSGSLEAIERKVT